MNVSKSGGFMQDILEKLPSGLVIVDRSLCVEIANPRFCRIFDLSEGEASGDALCDLLPLQNLRSFLQEVMRYGEVGTVRDFRWSNREDEVRRVRLTASVVNAGADSQPDCDEEQLMVVVDDITEEVRLRSMAQMSERGFREVIEHSPDGVAIHREDKFLYINPVFVKKFGVDDPEEVLGTSVYRYVHPDELEALQERTRRMLDTGEKVPSRETRLLRHDGTPWTVELTGRMVIFDGEPAIASIAHDVTEKKKLAARMMQLDRMIAIGTLATGVGHEINNPLTFVVTNLDFSGRRLKVLEQKLEKLDDDTVTSELTNIAEALADAEEGAKRIGDIVKQLRIFSKDSGDIRQSIPVNSIVDSVLHMVAGEIHNRAQLKLEFTEVPPIYGNDSRLRQVFLNLLLNAAHAIEEGAAERNEVVISVEALGECVRVEIRDSGAGIPPERLSRIFDPFYTTKPAGEGTGLGLYICQRIVEAHDGRIEVQSEPGEGTAFSVFLPISPATSPEA